MEAGELAGRFPFCHFPLYPRPPSPLAPYGALNFNRLSSDIQNQPCEGVLSIIEVSFEPCRFRSMRQQISMPSPLIEEDPQEGS